MVMSAESRLKCAALHRQCWRLHMKERFSSGTKTAKQTNTTNILPGLFAVKMYDLTYVFLYATLYLHRGHLVPINIELQLGVAFSSVLYRSSGMTGQNWSNNRLSWLTVAFEDQHYRRMPIYGFMSALRNNWKYLLK